MEDKQEQEQSEENPTNIDCIMCGESTPQTPGGTCFDCAQPHNEPPPPRTLQSCLFCSTKHTNYDGVCSKCDTEIHHSGGMSCEDDDDWPEEETGELNMLEQNMLELQNNITGAVETLNAMAELISALDSVTEGDIVSAGVPLQISADTAELIRQDIFDGLSEEMLEQMVGSGREHIEMALGQYNALILTMHRTITQYAGGSIPDEESSAQDDG